MSYPEIVFTSPARRDGNTLLYFLRIIRAICQKSRARGHTSDQIRANVAHVVERAFLRYHSPATREWVRAMAGRVLDETLGLQT